MYKLHLHTKVLTFIGILLFLSIFLHSCFVKPEFADTPKLEFESIQKITLPGLLNAKDSIIIALKFQDGDGDLGLSPADTIFPFQELNADGTPNEFHLNYYINLYRKVNGEFIQFEFGDVTLNGRFPSLNVEGQEGPLEGVLRRSVVISSAYPFRNDTIRFDVFIIDRALNKSNLVETDTVVVNVDP